MIRSVLLGFGDLKPRLADGTIVSTGRKAVSDRQKELSHGYRVLLADRVAQDAVGVLRYEIFRREEEGSRNDITQLGDAFHLGKCPINTLKYLKGAAVSDCKIIPFPLRDVSTAATEGGCKHEPAPNLAALYSLSDPDRWRRSRLYEVLKNKMLEVGDFVDQEGGSGREAWQPMLSPSKLLIADDHALFADALSSLVRQRWPSCEIRHIFDANLIAAELENAGGYDAILLDLRMPGMEGAQSVAKVVAAARGAPVILMSGLATGAEISEAFRAGISGFIPKSRTGEDLVLLLSQALLGEKSGAIPDEMVTEGDETLARLSPRERETALHMARGLSNKEIAVLLGISPETVKIYTKSIMTKFSVRNRTEFAIEAMRRGLV